MVAGSSPATSSNLFQMEEKIDYNSEPVEFCKHCLSLRVLESGIVGLCYCGECGSTDILTTTIDKWEVLYKRRYGKRFLDKK